MANCCSPNDIERYGANPVNIQWRVVRGDTATLTVDFLELDETTAFDTSNWTYAATVYDSVGDVLDALEVEATTGSVVITAPCSITERWGIGYKNVVAELSFDLSVQIGNNLANPTIWTPVIGTISVLGDVTPGGSL
jgi:hypothetical protein